RHQPASPLRPAWTYPARVAPPARAAPIPSAAYVGQARSARLKPSMSGVRSSAIGLAGALAALELAVALLPRQPARPAVGDFAVLDLLLQLDDGVQQRVRPWWAARHVHVHRQEDIHARHPALSALVPPPHPGPHPR